ncbi:type IV secretory system conjugative DNA transfer family protein [Nostoc sp. NIES-2111]
MGSIKERFAAWWAKVKPGLIARWHRFLVWLKETWAEMKKLWAKLKPILRRYYQDAKARFYRWMNEVPVDETQPAPETDEGGGETASPEIQVQRKLEDYKAEKERNRFQKDLKAVFERRFDPERKMYWLLIGIGTVLTPFGLIGALGGYYRGYNRLLADKDLSPRLYLLPKAIHVAIWVGAALGVLLLLLLVLLYVFAQDLVRGLQHLSAGFVVPALLVNLLLALLIMFGFGLWRNGIENYLAEKSRFGSARFASEDDLEPYEAKDKKGFYIGLGYAYEKQGHLLAVAGTRGGKGVNLILPNLLGMGGYQGSWVVIDPKGENAAVSARIQAERGRRVVMLNPWGLLGLPNHTYNPLDLLNAEDPNVIDDVQLIAETIVPTTAQGDTDHFNARARTIIAGLLLHLVTQPDIEERTLATLWEWLRLDTEAWIDLLAEMKTNSSKNGGDVCGRTAEEILALMKNGSREYASVLSTAQKWTDYLKSPALRQSLRASSFRAADLVEGNVTVYVIIPADRLKTHYQWLRLVVSAMMRSVIRQPKERVCFLLDEFYALGYLSEIDVALGSYAGYGVSVWAILQNLVQLHNMYRDNWESFISSCAVRHFFNLSDKTTLDYVSAMLGDRSVPSYNAGMVTGATARPLITPDELRRASAATMFTLIDQLPVARLPKLPYYDVLTEGKHYDRNPYLG